MMTIIILLSFDTCSRKSDFLDHSRSVRLASCSTYVLFDSYHCRRFLLCDLINPCLKFAQFSELPSTNAQLTLHVLVIDQSALCDILL